MTIGNLTPFGELNLYKRNGVGRQPSDRLPGCICWQVSIVSAKASKWGDTPSPVRCKFGNRACANTSTPVRITLCSSCILCNSGTATVAFLPVSSLLIAVPEFPGCWLRMATLEASRGPWSSAVLWQPQLLIQLKGVGNNCCSHNVWCIVGTTTAETSAGTWSSIATPTIQQARSRWSHGWLATAVLADSVRNAFWLLVGLAENCTTDEDTFK